MPSPSNARSEATVAPPSPADSHPVPGPSTTRPSAAIPHKKAEPNQTAVYFLVRRGRHSRSCIRLAVSRAQCRGQSSRVRKNGLPTLTPTALERLKILQQVQTRHAGGQTAYRGIWASLMLIWRKEGWRGYFRGNGISTCVNELDLTYTDCVRSNASSRPSHVSQDSAVLSSPVHSLRAVQEGS